MITAIPETVVGGLVAENLGIASADQAFGDGGSGIYEHKTDDDGYAGYLGAGVSDMINLDILNAWAYNAGWKTQAAIQMLVKEDDQSSEQAMGCDWHNDSTMDSAFDESQG